MQFQMTFWRRTLRRKLATRSGALTSHIYFGNKCKRYNCSIIDLYDRRVVASVNGRRINTELAIETVKKALKRSNGETGMILHSDRGSQFTSKQFAEFC